METHSLGLHEAGIIRKENCTMQIQMKFFKSLGAVLWWEVPWEELCTAFVPEIKKKNPQCRDELTGNHRGASLEESKVQLGSFMIIICLTRFCKVNKLYSQLSQVRVKKKKCRRYRVISLKWKN